VQIGPENAPRPVRAIENLATGEQYLLDWNRRRLRIDPAQNPCVAVPLSWLKDPI
jgi:starch synthase (maltosyl-transferring)